MQGVALISVVIFSVVDDCDVQGVEPTMERYVLVGEETSVCWGIMSQ